MTVEIALPSNLTSEHLAALGQYLRSDLQLDQAQWKLVWDAADSLRRATATLQGRTRTFASLYDAFVDQVYADPFIETLYHLSDLSQQAEGKRAKVARQSVVDLREAGYSDRTVPQTQVLLFFCLYWWQSFTKGYAFEVEILHDLAASDISHQAHNLRDRRSRLSSYDLVVMGFRGDIKTSPYFFSVERSQRLVHDFYITRLWDRHAHKWQGAVIVKPVFWAKLDGETTPSRLDRVLDLLPTVAEIEVDTLTLIVVEYETWKARVRTRQMEKGDE